MAALQCQSLLPTEEFLLAALASCLLWRNHLAPSLIFRDAFEIPLGVI